MKVLVTGGAGFIGMHLIKALINHNVKVMAIDNMHSLTYSASLKYKRLEHLGLNTKELEKANVINAGDMLEFKYLDITDTPAIRALIIDGNFDYIISLAALAGVRSSTTYPSQYVNTNINGFFNIIDAIKEIEPEKRPILIHASSSSVYGNCKNTPFKESDTNLNQESIYAATKMMDEKLAYSYHSLFNMDITLLRFFTVYGPFGRPDMAPFIFTKEILNNGTINIFNQGQLLRDFTYIDDIIQGIVKIIFEPRAKSFGIYNIGAGSPIKLMDFIDTLERVIGKSCNKKLLPMQQGDVYHTYADTSLLKADYNYQPTISLEQGLKEFYKWYKEFYK